jgi:hypothetical protein
MASTPESRIPDDEIDLRSLTARASRIIAYPFQLFKNNLLLTLVFVLLGVGLSVSLKYIIPKSYKSAFIFRPNDFKEKAHLRILGDIQVLLKHKDYQSLAKELGIDEKLATTFLSLEVYNPSIKNPVDSANITEVILTTTDYHSFLPIQESLLNYFENNPYFQKIKGLHIGQIAMNMALVEKDLVMLDSLKRIQLRNYERNQALNQNILSMNDLINPTATYSMAVERLNKKINLKAQEKFLNNFEVIKSCIANKNSDFPPRILVMCFYIVPFFLIMCFLYLHWKQKKLHRQA